MRSIYLDLDIVDLDKPHQGRGNLQTTNRPNPLYNIARYLC